MVTVLKKPSSLIHEIQIEKVGDWTLFKFSESLQLQMESLLEKKKADQLTPDEIIELDAIGELDRILLTLTRCLQLKMSISDEVKQTIRERAIYVCEYCHSSERLSANRFTVDHVIPRSLGGSDEIDNLALACRRCNERRYNFVAGIDPETQEVVPIFNPRRQNWKEHFVWIDSGIVIEGITSIGRATDIRLDLNDLRYPENDSIRETRRLWIKTGLHPPSDDLCQL